MALTAEQTQKALIAFQRFGLGPKPGGFDRIGADAKAALIAELNQPNVALIDNPKVPTYAVACREGTYDSARAEAVRLVELDARVDKHREPEIGFVERLVLFWANHFSVSMTRKITVRATVGNLERDVIRKHVLGKFSDMLIGVTGHPAMLCYLDNASSVGPGSIVGLSTRAGFNENLAREILELHTMGRDGQQTEADIRAFTKILTGWSYVRGAEADAGKDGGTQQNRGQFIYRANWHEPDPIAMMGKIYPAVGQKQAKLVLLDVARKSATATRLAYKLVQHFITDQPTTAMVSPLRDVFLRTGGDLKAMALALLDLPAAWSTPLRKIRTPYELHVAQFRALGYRYNSAEAPLIAQNLVFMQHVPWEAPMPTGYSDNSLDWLSPDGMTLRVDMARRVAWTLGKRYQGSIPTLAMKVYGPALSAAAKSRIAHAGDPRDALTILFASPEFQRR